MKHRIAILSDIHGNTTALEAVIKDAQELGATEYWLMGDIILPGPGRNELFELLSSIPITATVWSATKVVLYCRKSKCFPLYLCIYKTFTNFAPMQYGDSTLAP